MIKDQAAKLAQAYQWLSEGKEVECCEHHLIGPAWKLWDGKDTHWAAYRLKPEPLLEGWANLYPSSNIHIHKSAEEARCCAHPSAIRIAVHIREVSSTE